MSTSSTNAARRWLAGADPGRADRWASDDAVGLLPLGRVWDAVRLPALDGLRVAELDAIDGPVIHDPAGRTVYVLVPHDTSESWQVEGTERLGDTCHLAVPTPDRLQPPGPYWVQAPDGSGRLTAPAALANALTGTPALRLPAEAFG
ncbi:hypothetical protein [Streptomyces sp. bgisy100]|uniref:hypothetical protein n=1 Tax=Streptomyces sp. bgisy100 TaxID=3413783 RepID=UPI003D75DBA3